MSASKLNFSASTNGRGIKVVATATPGTLIHTASSDPNHQDEIFLYVYNNHTAAVVFTVEFGGVTVPDDIISQSIPSKSGLYFVVPGTPLRGNATPLLVRAFAASANVLVVTGWVNRIA